MDDGAVHEPPREPGRRTLRLPDGEMSVLDFGDPARPVVLPALEPWASHCRHWRDRLAAQSDLTARLLEFVRRKG